MAADGGCGELQRLAHACGADGALGQDNLEHPLAGALALPIDRGTGGHVDVTGGIHN
ncbi:hypothetical protein GCM10025784_27520 [Citricoccus nitrophenolicus]